MVLPQNWLFLTSYRKFRELLLKNDTWHMVIRLGSGAFETISGEVVKAILITISKGDTTSDQSGIFNIFNTNPIRLLDVSEISTTEKKSSGLKTIEIKSVEQVAQLNNPDSRVLFESIDRSKLFLNHANCYLGLHVGGWDAYRRKYWELPFPNKDWVTLQCSVDGVSDFSGLNDIAYWPDDGAIHTSNPRARVQGRSAWGKLGIILTPMGNLPVARYLGGLFDNNNNAIIPIDEKNLGAIYCFTRSPNFRKSLREIDQAVKITNATVTKIPFNFDRWDNIAQIAYPNGLPYPFSDDPTQWIFHGHPCGSVVWNEEAKWTAQDSLRSDATVLQVAVARLLGYRWPAELDTNMELADEQREWVNRCEAMLPYADDDGIVCIPPVRGESSATDRLLNLLAVAYGDAWSGDILAQLLKSADHGRKTLETWLRDKFFTQHCRLFHHRPFIWHIWDGLHDGFAALVNYHKLVQKNLETLIYTYLGDWINRQTQDIANGVDGAEEKLSASESLKKKLVLILEGEAPHDIFVRWKPIEKQPIGWNPDLNDGVRINIRPFMTVGDVKKKGAGVLRDKPNIKWSKDRGKDVESAPWYHQFKGDRINDHHLDLNSKSHARRRNR